MKVMILISDLPLQREKCAKPDHLRAPANLNLLDESEMEEGKAVRHTF